MLKHHNWHEKNGWLECTHRAWPVFRYWIKAAASITHPGLGYIALLNITEYVCLWVLSDDSKGQAGNRTILFLIINSRILKNSIHKQLPSWNLHSNWLDYPRTVDRLFKQLVPKTVDTGFRPAIDCDCIFPSNKCDDEYCERAESTQLPVSATRCHAAC